jgi:Protein of unknown function (DUF2637)
MQRFSDLSPLGRAIIVAVAVGTAAIAAAAFALSYGALYAWVHETGLYADAGPWAGRLEQAWPLMLDAAFIVAELAAILGGILRGPRGWPILVMILTGTLTVVFNVLHAQTPAARVAAALPPVLMMACFQIDLAIVGWVMRALGRADGGVPPGAFLGVPQTAPQMQTARWPRAGTGQLGQWGSGVDGGVSSTKRAQIEAVLDRLGPEEAMELQPEGIVGILADQGVDTHPRYVRKVMDARIAGRNGKDRP